VQEDRQACGDRVDDDLSPLSVQVLIGTPDIVTERLRILQEEIGIDCILAELNCGGLIPHERVMTALRLICEAVMPRFH
jgi:hypothetical protein